MTDTLSANFVGLDLIVNNLHQLNAEIEAKIQALLETHGDGTLDDAMARAPVSENDEDGHVHMRDTGHVDKAAGRVEVTFDAPYSLFVNDGHITSSGSFVPPDPFLTEPFFMHARQLQDDMDGLVP